MSLEETLVIRTWRAGVLAHLCFALFLGISSWWLGEYANADAWAQTEKNAAESLGGEARSSEEIFAESVQRQSRDWGLLLFTSAIFGIPAVAMLLLYRHPNARIVVLTVACALLLWDLAVATAPHGGDRKGCTNCDAPGIAHLLADFFILTGSLITAVVGGLKRLFSSR